jgi:putative flippase GtrA
MTESSPAAPADRAQRVPGQADGVPRRARRRGTSQLLRFACVGVASTAAFTLLYLGLRGIGISAQAANAISQFLTAVGNTAANRRVTFGIRGSADVGWHYVQGLIAFGAGLVVTSGALAALHAVSARPARIIEVIVLVTATLVATLVRFALYKTWVFRPRRHRS